MASGSRFDALANAADKMIASAKDGVEDVVKEKQLEAKLSRIDADSQQKIDEIKSEPVNTELIKQQAKADLESIKKMNAREKAQSISESEDDIREAELALKKAKEQLVVVKELASEREEKKNLQATQGYDRIVASAGNVEQTIALRVKRVEQEAVVLKRDIQIELDTIKILNEAKKEAKVEYQKLYNDIKEISIKVGDSNK